MKEKTSTKLIITTKFHFKNSDNLKLLQLNVKTRNRTTRKKLMRMTMLHQKKLIKKKLKKLINKISNMTPGTTTFSSSHSY